MPRSPPPRRSRSPAGCAAGISAAVALVALVVHGNGNGNGGGVDFARFSPLSPARRVFFPARRLPLPAFSRSASVWRSLAAVKDGEGGLRTPTECRTC